MSMSWTSSPVTIALSLRILIALCTRTYFQPDEYFQALEPAHALVFGYGHLTWEWLTPQPIRSILYPAVNVPLYWALKALNLDKNRLFGDALLVAGPRILHGAFAAATDIWLRELARKVLGPRYVSTSFWLSLTSTFHALSLSRSFSNSLETSLSTIAFSYFPWDAGYNLSPALIDRKHVRKSLIFAALACGIRPTSAIIWAFLFSNLLWQMRSSRRIFGLLMRDALVIGATTLIAMLAVDSLYYAKLTFPPLSFLLTNLSSVSLFYGGNPWHFYVSAALPILCTTALPFVVLGMWATLQDHPRNTGAMKFVFQTIVWTIAIYSLAGHKEWRFIHPLLPLLHLFAAKWLVDHSSSALATKKGKSKEMQLFPFPSVIDPKYAHAILSTIPVSIYLVALYCSGPISSMSYLRSLPSPELMKGIGVLMPCHSLPGYAYLHREELAGGRFWALGCEPPLQ
ncbi:hypothetical protein HGRIS_012920 [Hohenbuehelia grisea]